MGATNSTPVNHFPLFVDDDKPSWLGDFNSAMQKAEDIFNEQAAKISTMQGQIVTLQAQVAVLEGGA
jgi:hypothetical protein